MALLIPSYSFSQNNKQNNLGLKTVVIDAGHGGKDAGCVSKDKKTYEKTLNLNISKYLSDAIIEAYPDVNVILTRKTDKYLTLAERAMVANNNKADLFISIHINSVNSPNPNGFSVHVLGQSKKKDTDLFSYNMDVCRRENSVILLEEDYSTKYQGFDPNDPQSFIFFSLMQNAHLENSLKFAEILDQSLKKGPISKSRGVWQDPFYLLWKTTMPSVLIECGFISNAEDLKAMRTEKCQKEIAMQIFEAFKVFKADYDLSIMLECSQVGNQVTNQNNKQVSNNDTTKKQGDETSEELQYGVQIFTLSKKIEKNDSRFLGYEPLVISTGSAYKYIIGLNKDLNSAKADLEKIRLTYPDSFIIKLNQ